MASTRFGHLDDFTQKNNKVGIGTSTPQEKMEIIGGTRSEDLRVAGIATLTSAGGFIEKHLQYTDDQILFDTGDGGTLSGEIVVGSGQTITVGAAATTSQGTVEALKVYDMFKPPSGGTNQRPVGKPGALFYNFDFKTIEFFDGNGWRQVDNTTRSGRAITGGGLSPGNTPHSTVDLITIPTLGNSVNFGELHTARSQHGACSSSTRGLFLGGGSPAIDAIEYYTLASSGNGIDFGNLTSTGRRYTSSFSSSTRGFSAGGKDDPAVTNEIDYVEISTIGDALDFGDLTVAALYWSGLSSPTRGFTLVADDPAAQTINMVTMASKGNAVDFGNQSKTGGYQAAAANSVRGLWAGGYSSAPRQSVGRSSSIEAITMASQGTTQYFGDLSSITSQYGDGSSTSTRAVFCIGKIAAGNNFRTNIEYVTIASSGTASDFGDATFPVAYRGVTSDSHGGLGGF